LVEFLLLQFQRPGDANLHPVAVLLFDPCEDRLHICGREEYATIAEAEDAEVLAATVEQLQKDAEIQSGTAILKPLESTLSNSIRLTGRIAFSSLDLNATLRSLSAIFLS
jgi:hypothetical protein